MFNAKVPVISSASYDKKELFKYIATKCKSFLDINSTSTNNEDLAFQFAEDVTETRLDWKPLDIDLFFKTVRQRQDIEAFKVLGNKITGLKLGEMVVEYEDIRASYFEQYNKQKWSVPEKQDYPTDIKKFTEPILARLRNPVREVEIPKGTNVVQGFMRDFDELYNKQAKGKSVSALIGMRTVEVDGVVMNIEDYLKFKIGCAGN